MIITIDIETYKWSETEQCYIPILNSQEFTLGAILCEEWKQPEFFTNSQDMYARLIQIIQRNAKQKRKTFIYGHNVEYDWYGVAKGHLFDNNTKYYCTTPFLGNIAYKGLICDTMSFYKCGLKEIGEMINYPKLEMPPKVTSIEQIKPYLARDVEITLKAIHTIKNQLQSLGFSPNKLITAGQVAMTCFLTHCKQNGTFFTFMYLKDDKPQIYKSLKEPLMRKAYRGGDNTAFFYHI